MTEVIVVAPVRVHRESLSTALADAESLDVVGTAPSMAEALPLLRHLAPQVAVLDASTPQEVGLLAFGTTELEENLLAVGVPEDEAIIWLEAGVSGCVPPEASLDDLAAAVASVARGEIVMSPAVPGHLLRRIRWLAAAGNPKEDGALLTPRQTDVLDLVAEGFSNKQIAQRLSIQEQTVKNHMHNVLLKLGVHRRAEAAALLRRSPRRSLDR